ncbi:hypothetical protein RF11_05444 [Thelohanellus kitauei]|uniref:Uncharacterized protein n=1 Tax=Thelohanellus kitauei TaxID=669202 RepID=A0A0C2MJV8_THEKT|nr:hypothetical protein RF11_05444 [Thelohanellus kitauei]
MSDELIENTKSLAQVNPEIKELSIDSQKLDRSKTNQSFQKYLPQEAGKAYFDAARVDEIHFKDDLGAFSLYNKAAKCYLQIKSSRAIECYEKRLEILLRMVIN